MLEGSEVVSGHVFFHMEEVGLWKELAMKPAFMETQMKATKEIDGILTLVLAVQRQWYNPALPVGLLLVPCWPVVAQTKFQLRATKVLAKVLSQMVISPVSEIYSCGNTLTRKHSCYLDIVLNYKGILPTVSWIPWTGNC